MNRKALISLLGTVAITFAFGAMKEAAPADDIDGTLSNLEKKSWEAWQKRDAVFYQTFLSDDHVEVGGWGVSGKKEVLATVASPACEVKSFKVDGIKVTRLALDVALLTYRAEQETVCSGKRVPSPVWVSSLYLFRGGRWQNAAYQQTPVLTATKNS